MVRFLLKLCAFILLSAGMGYGIYFLDPVLDQASAASLLLANLLPALCLFLLCWGLTRRILLAFIISAGLVSLLFIINDNKILHLGEPLIFADAYLLPQMISGWDLMHEYANVPLMILGGVAIIAFFYLLWRYEKPSLRWGVNLLILAMGAGGFHYLGKGQGIDKLYDSRNDNASPWQFFTQAESKGLLASLVTGARLTQLSRPSYDTNLIHEYAQDVNREADDNQPQPDIILWLSESFFDPQILNGVDSCSIWPLFCELQSRGLTAQMQVSTYAGNTTRTEFEVLTGVPFKFLEGHDYPYISAVNAPTHSIAWALQNQGYKTLAVHPHDRTFWQRHRAIPLLGFQQFEGEESFRNAKRSGYYIADKYLAQRALEHLDAADEPLFLLAISMENHGPWGTGTRKNLNATRLAEISVPEELRESEEAALAWREYMYHGEKAMQALAELYEFILKRDRPMLLVFFGDHLPGLGEVFKELGFKDGSTVTRQKLPVIALANYPLNADWTPAYANDLGVWTLYLADQLGDQYFAEMNKALAELRGTTDSPSPMAEPALAAMQARVLATRAQMSFSSVASFETARNHTQLKTSRFNGSSSGICDLGEWGPKETRVGIAANEQPDGSMGVWMKTACFPQKGGVMLGDNSLRVVRTDFGVTTSIPLNLLASPGNKPIYFVNEESGEKRLMGHIEVKD